MLSLERAQQGRRVTWLSLIGLILVPVIVAGGFLAATYKAGDRLENVQAAVVNQDQAVTVDGQTVPLGRQLAAGLIDSEEENFEWKLVDADEAKSGIESGKYAAVVTIPPNFSKAATSFGGDAAKAEKATIDVITSKVGGVADAAIGNQIATVAAKKLNNTLTKTYLDNIYVGFNEIGEQFAEVADGAEDLATGAQDLTSGIDAASDGAGQLANGLGELSRGGKDLDQGAKDLATGVGGLSDGLDQLAKGTEELPRQSRELANGTKQLADGIDEYAVGASGYATAVDGYTDGVVQTVEAIKTTSKGVSKLDAQLNPTVPSTDGQPTKPAPGGSPEDLVKGAEGLTNGAKGLNKGLVDYKKGLSLIPKGLELKCQAVGVSGPALSDGGAVASAPDGATADRGEAETTSSPRHPRPSKSPTGDSATESATPSVPPSASASDGATTSPSPSASASTTESASPSASETEPPSPSPSSTSATKSASPSATASGSSSPSGTASGSSGSATDEQLCAAYVAGAQAAVAQAQGGLGAPTDPKSLLGGSSKLAQGAGQLEKGVKAVVKSLGELPKQITELRKGVSTLATGLETLSTKSSALTKNAPALDKGAKQLSTGATTIGTNARAVSTGVGQFAGGLTTLSAGIGASADGASQLSTGADTYSTGVTAYTSGVTQSEVGAKDLSDGLTQLSDGGEKLADGVDQLATGLAEGAEEIPSYGPDERANLADVVAEPVQPSSGDEGDSLISQTPATTLLMVLALWLGALATFLILAAVPTRTFVSSSPSWQLAAKAMAPGAAIAAVQAVVLTLIGQSVLSLSAGTVASLLALLLLAGFAFVGVNHALVAWFGGIGRLISVVMVVITAASSIVSAVPGFFDVLKPFSPLTPALQAARGIVTDGPGVGGAVAVLLVWLTLAIVASVASVLRSRTVTPKQLLARG